MDARTCGGGLHFDATDELQRRRGVVPIAGPAATPYRSPMDTAAPNPSSRRRVINRPRSLLVSVASLLTVAGCADGGPIEDALTRARAASASAVVTSTTSSVPKELPFDAFRAELCGAAPDPAIDAAVSGGVLDADYTLTGSWFGDGVTCTWEGAGGVSLEVTFYVAPDPGWTSRPAQFEELHEIANMPVTISEIRQAQYSVPSSDTSVLVSHFVVAMPSALRALCRQPLSEVFGSLQQERAQGYAAVCAGSS